MNVYKFTGEGAGYNNLKNRFLYEIDGQLLVLATPTKQQRFIPHYWLNQFIKKGWLETLDLLKEKWIHPHLYKPIKKEVYENLK